MAYIRIDTSARRILSASFGLIEVGLGVVQLAQGLRRIDWGAMQSGLKAMGLGLASIQAGFEAGGGRWGDISVQFRRIVWLWVYIRMRGAFRPLVGLIARGGRV